MSYVLNFITHITVLSHKKCPPNLAIATFERLCDTCDIFFFYFLKKLKRKKIREYRKSYITYHREGKLLFPRSENNNLPSEKCELKQDRTTMPKSPHSMHENVLY